MSDYSMRIKSHRSVSSAHMHEAQNSKKILCKSLANHRLLANNLVFANNRRLSKRAEEKVSPRPMVGNPVMPKMDITLINNYTLLER